MLNPELAAQQQAAATPDPSRPDLSEAQRRAAEAEESRVRQESLLKGMQLSKGVYERQRVRRQMVQMHLNDLSRLDGQGAD